MKELEKENDTAESASGRPIAGQCDHQGGVAGKMTSPARRREAVEQALKALDVSQSGECAGQSSRCGQCSATSGSGANDKAPLTQVVVALASQYGRCGYRRVTALLCNAGW